MIEEEEELIDEVTIGITPVLISTQKQRQEINYTNMSAGGQTIKIVVGKMPSAYTGAGGVPLLPYAVYWATASAGFKPTRKDVYAVASAAGAVLAMFER